jgi:AcrR family transcriptional regulator
MVRSLSTEKRRAILHAAKQAFLEKGFESARMAEVASKAGVASGTLYIYFKSKDALVCAIWGDVFEQLGDEFELLVRQFSTPDGVVAFIDWVIMSVERQRDVLEIFTASASSITLQGRSKLVEKLAVNLEQLMQRGYVRKYPNARLLADFVFVIARQVAISYLSCRGESIAELKEAAITFITHALYDDLAVAASNFFKNTDRLASQ